MKIATGKEPRPPELDKFAAVFSVAGEKQEKAADEETAILLKGSCALRVLRRQKRNSSAPNELRSDSTRIRWDRFR